MRHPRPTWKPPHDRAGPKEAANGLRVPSHLQLFVEGPLYKDRLVRGAGRNGARRNRRRPRLGPPQRRLPGRTP
jgi:hypothetical protein